MTCYFSDRPNADFFVRIAPHIALAYSTFVIATNVLYTTHIGGRILWIRRKMEASGAGGGAAKAFTGAVSLTIESMLLYTVFGVAYVAMLGANIPGVSILFLSLYVMFTMRTAHSIHLAYGRITTINGYPSPQMIILRMLMGRGWTQETTTMWTRTLEASPTSTKASLPLCGKDEEDAVAKDMPDDVRVYETGCAV